MRKINVLLSCPSDVFANFSQEIYQAVSEVNYYIERILDTHIELLHYSSSSYSQVGKSPQDHLDDTLIINSDVCIAFYYKKIGTPTKKYRSGTDEEIHIMKDQGKHVSLFRIYDSKDEQNDWFGKIKDLTVSLGYAASPKEYKNEPEKFIPVLPRYYSKDIREMIKATKLMIINKKN